MNVALFVALGGALGSVTRYGLSTVVQQRWGGMMPVGTLVVNILGSFLVGFILRYALGSASVSVEARALLATGFCGGFTTFSAFSYEALALVESGDYARAALYVGASLVLALAATFGGVIAARELLMLRHGT
jgi:fluoride exporter